MQLSPPRPRGDTLALFVLVRPVVLEPIEIAGLVVVLLGVA
jgi:hypothetical protein